MASTMMTRPQGGRFGWTAKLLPWQRLMALFKNTGNHCFDWVHWDQACVTRSQLRLQSRRIILRTWQRMSRRASSSLLIWSWTARIQRKNWWSIAIWRAIWQLVSDGLVSGGDVDQWFHEFVKIVLYHICLMCQSCAVLWWFATHMHWSALSPSCRVIECAVNVEVVQHCFGSYV